MTAARKVAAMVSISVKAEARRRRVGGPDLNPRLPAELGVELTRGSGKDSVELDACFVIFIFCFLLVEEKSFSKSIGMFCAYLKFVKVLHNCAGAEIGTLLDFVPSEPTKFRPSALLTVFGLSTD